MITLTKEWLLTTIAELEEERDSMPGVVNVDAAMSLAAMKLALASLEAEPVISHVGSKNALDAIVAFIKSNRNPTLKDYNEVSERLFQDNCHGLSNHVIEYIKQIGEELEELRSTQDTAPPAPVAMKDHQIRELVNELRDIAVKYHGSQQLREHIARTIRAAMLQGVENAETPTTMQTAPALDSSPKIAESPTGINQGKSEPVTTANKLSFEQWLSQQTGTIDVECGCVMTEVFFHWLRVAYEAGNSPHCREILNSSTKNFRENAETSTKCWCRTCRPVTFADSHFVVCPECGNKRCPHANDHRNACTGSNEPGQEGSAYPAAPRQEVK
ncbi:hypothetical protein ABR28_09360 [Enterobacter hormaechei subsp. hoffmannii]|nr:hypothetical protein ABR28_09360 [Enterobacter hormaechei subsp. hoffmannii]